MPKKAQRARKPRGPRKRFIYLSMLNVKATPHESGAKTYADLWNTAVTKRVSAVFHRDKRARIETARALEDGMIVGEISTFTQVGAKNGILRIADGQMLDPDEVQNMAVNLEGHGFNPQKIAYAFDTRTHRFGFEFRSGRSPGFLQYILTAILNAPAVTSGAGISSVVVEVEQEKGVLDKLFALDLSWLNILISKPNPDDIGENLEAQYAALLDAENAQSQQIEYRAEKGAHLTPTTRTRRVAELALSNGGVTGRGIDPETRRTLTLETKEAPLKEVDLFNPKLEDYWTFLARRTRIVAEQIRQRLARVVQDVDQDQ
jgi:hypothetical protein